MTAEQILEAALQALRDRAASRDTKGGERSMSRAVALYNWSNPKAARKYAETGAGSPLMDEADGWLFMLCLKVARSAQGQPHADDYVDMAGYAALLGECVTGGRGDD